VRGRLKAPPFDPFHTLSQLEIMPQFFLFFARTMDSCQQESAIIPWMLYPNKLKNWEFANAESHRFDAEKTDPLFFIGAVFSGSKMGFSAKAKTDSSACLGINPKQVEELRICQRRKPQIRRRKNRPPIFYRSKG
jgi:hypothetical protein